MTGVERYGPIHQAAYRKRATVKGMVESVGVEPVSGVPTLECRLVDDSGSITLVFLGRRQVPGVVKGATLSVEGMVGRHRGLLAIVNPEFSVVPRTSTDEAAS
jgi:RecG-like helicase